MDTKTTNGKKQLKEIITKVMEIQDYPDFSFVNNVLSCEELLGKRKLWLWFSELRIVEEHQGWGSGVKSGEMKILESWDFKDGEIKLVAKI